MTASIEAGSAPKGILANGDGVWAADLHGGAVLRIDPAIDEVGERSQLARPGRAGQIGSPKGLGSIWADIPNNRTIVRVDPVTDVIQATIDAAGPIGVQPCGGMAINDDATWVTSCASGSLMARIDANSNTLVDTIDMGGNGYNPIMINGFIWVSVDGGDAESGSLVRINPDTNAIDRVLVPSTLSAAEVTSLSPPGQCGWSTATTTPTSVLPLSAAFAQPQ